MKPSLTLLLIFYITSIELIGTSCNNITDSNEKARSNALSLEEMASIDTTGIPYPAAETKIGVALAAPKYNPFGARSMELPYRASLDMDMLGFSTIKLWLNIELLDPKTSVIPETIRATLHNSVDILKLPVYQRILDLPVDTLVFFPDSFKNGSHIWSIKRNQPFSEIERQEIYDAMYKTASYLLTRLSGSGKTVILQNHEGDWHLVDTVKENRPSEVQLQNMAVYLSERQRAVNDARSHVNTNQFRLYHMCEIVDVVRPMNDDYPAIVNRILPNLTCDLIGYSAYDSSLDSVDTFKRSLDYVKSKARPSKAFGSNNVTISEIGYDDRANQVHHAKVIEAIRHAINLKVPYVLTWTSYDNECQQYEGDPQYLLSVSEDRCKGFWMRKSNAELSPIYRDLVPHLNTPVERFVQKAYAFYHNRAPSHAEIEYWKNAHAGQGIPWIDEKIRRSPEAKDTFIQRLYKEVLNRVPIAGEESFWRSHLEADSFEYRQIANEFFLAAIRNEPNAINPAPVNPAPVNPAPVNPTPHPDADAPVKALVSKWYQFYLGRDPDASGLDYWVTQAKSGGCYNVAKAFVHSVGYQRENGVSLSNADFVNAMYKGFLGRNPDNSGYLWWIEILDDGASRSAMINDFLNNNEFKSLCATAKIP